MLNRQELQEKCRQCIKSSGVFFIFLAYVFGGAGLFYAVETRMSYVLDPRQNHSYEHCLGNKNYWAAVFYTTSSCTTFAFGDVQVCTVISRILTIVYCFFGIPLTVYVLTETGRKSCDLLVTYYKRLSQSGLWRKRQQYAARVRHTLSQASLCCIRVIGRYCHRPRRGKSVRCVVKVDTLEDWPDDAQADFPTSHLLLHTSSLFNPALAKAENGHARNMSKAERNRRLRAGSSLRLTIRGRRISSATVSSTTSNLLVEDADDLPDIPLWVCAVAIVGQVICVMMHISMSEDIPLRWSLYYSMTFLLVQHVEIRSNFVNTIPRYFLLLLCLGTVSLTINAIFHNIHNFVARIKAKIPEAVRAQRKQAVADGGPSGPDAEASVPTDEEIQAVIEQLIAKETGGKTGFLSFKSTNSIPKSTMADLTQFCSAVIEGVDMEIKQEALVQRLEQAEAEIANTAPPVTIDSGVGGETGVVSQGGMSVKKLRVPTVDAEQQTDPEKESRATSITDLAVEPTYRDMSIQTDDIEMNTDTQSKIGESNALKHSIDSALSCLAFPPMVSGHRGSISHVSTLPRSPQRTGKRVYLSLISQANIRVEGGTQTFFQSTPPNILPKVEFGNVECGEDDDFATAFEMSTQTYEKATRTIACGQSVPHMACQSSQTEKVARSHHGMLAKPEMATVGFSPNNLPIPNNIFTQTDPIPDAISLGIQVKPLVQDEIVATVPEVVPKIETVRISTQTELNIQSEGSQTVGIDSLSHAVQVTPDVRTVRMQFPSTTKLQPYMSMTFH